MFPPTERRPAAAPIRAVAGKNQIFSFKGDWLRKFKPGAKVSVRLTRPGMEASQTFDTQLMVQRGVLDGRSLIRAEP